MAWNSSTGSVAGYRMHYGTTSGNYDYSVDVGNSTSCTISGLQEGDTYYFAVTAYNGSSESEYSDEINYQVPSDNSVQSSSAATVNSSPGAATTYEDAGDGTTYGDAEDGTTKGWDIYDRSPGGASIKNVYDSDRQSRVIQLSGSETDNGYRLRDSGGAKWHNSAQFTIQWSMKYSEDFTVYIEAKTTAGRRFLVYEPVDYDNLGSGTYVRYGLGSDVTDGRWHPFTRDLEADLADAQPGARVLEVNGFLIRGSGKVDDIQLLGGDTTSGVINVNAGTAYEDAEDGTTKGWDIYDRSPGGASIKNVYDSDRQSRVIQLSGSETYNGYRLRDSGGAKWHNSAQFTIQWSMKYAEEFTVYIEVKTTAGTRYLVYEPVDYDDLGSNTYVRYGLGSDVTDRRWHTLTRNLKADLADAQPGARVLEVNGFLIRGSGKVDDIIFLNQ